MDKAVCVRILMLSALCWGWSTYSRADAPPLLPLQGYLTDDGGAPVDGTREITVTLYDDDDEVLYRETREVAIEDGRLALYLGDRNSLPLDVFASNTLVFVGIQVDDDPEMTPRFQLGTVPYAAMANDASTLDGHSLDDLQRRIHDRCESGDVAVGVKRDGSMICESVMGMSGPPGHDGDDGEDGASCWDTNSNGECDSGEDRDGGGCSVSDCQPGAGSDAVASGQSSGYGLSESRVLMVSQTISHGGPGKVVAIANVRGTYNQAALSSGFANALFDLTSDLDPSNQQPATTLTWRGELPSGSKSATLTHVFSVTGSGSFTVRLHGAAQSDVSGLAATGNVTLIFLPE